MACLSMSLSLACYHMAHCLGPATLGDLGMVSSHAHLSFSLCGFCSHSGNCTIPAWDWLFTACHHMAHCHCSGTCRISAPAAARDPQYFYLYHYSMPNRSLSLIHCMAPCLGLAALVARHGLWPIAHYHHSGTCDILVLP
ncbi:hypothetical protein ACRRTK_022948 [Alexandromys fortis]